jgi:hypothetical protein
MNWDILIKETSGIDAILLTEQPLGAALKSCLWRFLFPVTIFQFWLLVFWLLQVSTLGLAAFGSLLFLLFVLTLLVGILLWLTAIYTQPDRRVVQAIGVSGWFRQQYLRICMSWLAHPLLLLYALSKYLPSGPLQLMILERILMLELKLIPLYSRYLAIWRTVLTHSMAYRPAATAALVELEKLWSDLPQMIGETRILLHHLRQIREDPSLSNAAAIRQIVNAVERLLSVFPSPLVGAEVG